MPAAAIPAIAMAGGSIGSGLLNYFSAKGASKPKGEEAAAGRAQASAGNELGQRGRELSGFGMPKLQQAGNYFSTLAGGNRAATTQALAPETENINAIYGGTQRTLARFLKGPDRDYQFGELARQKAGTMGSLFRDARDRGVQGLTSLGQYGVSQGMGATEGAANIAGSVANRGMSNRYGGADLQRQAGQDSASLIFQLLKSGAFKWGKGTPSLPGTNIPISIPSGGR